MNDFIDFKKLIPQALLKYKLNREARAAQICSGYGRLAKDLGIEDAKAKFFKGHTLYISVPSSIAAQRVFNHRHDILTKLNVELGKEEIFEIRTVLE